MAQIVLEGITKSFGETRALTDVNLEARDGEFLVLLGPSGCGKSTLLRVVAGLVAPDTGRVIVGDRDVTQLPPGRRDIAMVFQSYALYPHLSVERNLGFGLRVRRMPTQEIETRVAQVAERLRLSPLLRRRPKELSGGERQRVALGRAMVRDPSAFLMDEPLSNLDAQLRNSTRVELAQLHRSLVSTFIYVTHDQVEAMTMADRIAILHSGQLEQIGTPAEVYDTPATSFVAGFIGAPPMNLFSATCRSRDGWVSISAERTQATLFEGYLAERQVVAGVRPEHLERVEPERAQMTGTVEALEITGSEEVAFIRMPWGLLTWRGSRPLGVRTGELAYLAADPARILLFDPVSSRRLVWVDDPVRSTVKEQTLVP